MKDSKVLICENCKSFWLANTVRCTCGSTSLAPTHESNRKFVKFTTREKLENMLIDRGMSYTQASEVIELAIPELNKLSEYHIDFDSINNYPELMYDVLFVSIKPIALKYIEEKLPMAWFKPMFF